MVKNPHSVQWLSNEVDGGGGGGEEMLALPHAMHAAATSVTFQLRLNMHLLLE